jgi:hypothetical protein
MAYLAVTVTDATSVARAFGIADAVLSQMARADNGDIIGSGSDGYLRFYATLTVPSLRRNVKRSAISRRSLVLFWLYKYRDAHFDAIESLNGDAQAIISVASSTLRSKNTPVLGARRSVHPFLNRP